MRHAVFAVAVLVLFVNDHFLKAAYPGFITGKLSDIAGMIYFPLLLEMLLAPMVKHRRLLLACCTATAIAFTLTKTTAFGNDAFRLAWGAMQWPWYALRGEGFPRVVLVQDPTDVIAVPFVLIALYTGSRRFKRTSNATSMSTVMPSRTAANIQN